MCSSDLTICVTDRSYECGQAQFNVPLTLSVGHESRKLVHKYNIYFYGDYGRHSLTKMHHAFWHSSFQILCCNVIRDIQTFKLLIATSYTISFSKLNANFYICFIYLVCCSFFLTDCNGLCSRYTSASC